MRGRQLMPETMPIPSVDVKPRSVPFYVDLGVAALALAIGIALLFLILVFALTPFVR